MNSTMTFPEAQLAPMDQMYPQAAQNQEDAEMYNWMFSHGDPFVQNLNCFAAPVSGPMDLKFEVPASAAAVQAPPAKKARTTVSKAKTTSIKSKTTSSKSTTTKKSTTSRVTKRKSGKVTEKIPDVVPPNAKIEIVQTIQVGAAKLKKSDPNYEKKLRRLLRNRQVARDCRKRKREKMEVLENEVVRLREWNRQLEIKLNEGKEGTEKEENRQRELKKLRTLVLSRRSESEIGSAVEKFSETFADFGLERKAAIQFHLKQLKSLLMPTQACKMTMWSLQQNEEFYDETSNQQTFGGGIWNMISSTCKFTEDQKKRITSPAMRESFRQQRNEMATALNALSGLERSVNKNLASLESNFKSLQQTATPTQQARFLLWIEDNQACMHMLKNMWNEQDEVLGASMTNSSSVHTNNMPAQPQQQVGNASWNGQAPLFDLDLVDPLGSPGSGANSDADSIDVDFFMPSSPTSSIF